MAFVALLIAMGINKSSQYRMYWSTSEILQIPFYLSIMPRNRFSSIIRFIHVSNDQMPRTASAKQDTLAKVRPFIAVLIPKFLNLYNHLQNLSPDESIVMDELSTIRDQLYNQDSVNQKHRTPNSPYSIIIYSHGTRPNPLDVH